MTYVLDTDHLSILDRDDSPYAARLRDRMAAVPADDFVATIISFEEQTRGWLAVLARARTVTRQVEAYERLLRHLNAYRRIPTLPFDGAGAIEFQRIQKLRLRVGTMDLRIASIALSRGLTLLTRNFVDFRKVPGLACEDWTA